MSRRSASWGACYDEEFQAKLTKLYAIRAHARGRVHRCRARLTANQLCKLGRAGNRWDAIKMMGDPMDGHAKFDLTIEDQARFIGDEWKKYEKQELASAPTKKSSVLNTVLAMVGALLPTR